MDTVHNSHDAVRLVYPVLYGLDHEEAWVIFLTTCNGVIAAEMLSKGTLTNTAIDSRTILRQALLHNAASIILCHNHPSGNERPSTADIGQTEIRIEARNLFNHREFNYATCNNLIDTSTLSPLRPATVILKVRFSLPS